MVDGANCRSRATGWRCHCRPITPIISSTPPSRWIAHIAQCPRPNAFSARRSRPRGSRPSAMSFPENEHGEDVAGEDDADRGAGIAEGGREFDDLFRWLSANRPPPKAMIAKTVAKSRLSLSPWMRMRSKALGSTLGSFGNIQDRSRKSDPSSPAPSGTCHMSAQGQQRRDQQQARAQVGRARQLAAQRRAGSGPARTSIGIDSLLRIGQRRSKSHSRYPAA